jgi:uncharacterized membrane-anchored protein YhcB (DUF1043 family)
MEKPDRIGLRVAALIVLIAWVSVTVRYWDEAPQGLVLGWVIIGAVLWRLGKPDREREVLRAQIPEEQARLLAESRSRDETRRQELLGRLAADMRTVTERHVS